MASTTNSNPLSLRALQEELLVELLGDLKGSRTAFRYANGTAYLPIARGRMGIVTLAGCSDSEEPEYTGITLEVRDSGITLHKEEVPFADLHPLRDLPPDPACEYPELQQDSARQEVLARIVRDATGKHRLRLVSVRFEDEGTDLVVTEAHPPHTWMGPVMDALKVWAAA